MYAAPVTKATARRRDQFSQSPKSQHRLVRTVGISLSCLLPLATALSFSLPFSPFLSQSAFAHSSAKLSRGAVDCPALLEMSIDEISQVLGPPIDDREPQELVGYSPDSRMAVTQWEKAWDFDSVAVTVNYKLKTREVVSIVLVEIGKVTSSAHRLYQLAGVNESDLRFNGSRFSGSRYQVQLIPAPIGSSDYIRLELYPQP